MSLQLPPEQHRIVLEEVRQGHFPNEQAVIDAALARLQLDPIPELDEEALEAIDGAEVEIDEGKVHDLESVRETFRQRFKGQ